MAPTHGGDARSQGGIAAEPSAPTRAQVAGSPEAQPCTVGKSGVSIGDRAFEKLRRLFAERGAPEAGLRVAVQGGGCSGFAYKLTWEARPHEKDRIFAREEVRIFVDPKSYLFLIGSLIEYEEQLLEAGFKVTNPRVTSTCGCGGSFTVG